MSNAIVPEIVGHTEILEGSPMTEQEQKELIETQTICIAASKGIMERQLILGEALSRISRNKLYRGINGGRTWEQYLKEESTKLTGNPDPLKPDTARHLRAFYQFRNEILLESDPGLVLPTAVRQVRPLIGEMSANPKAAIEIWKAACSMAGAKKVPSFAQVQDVYLRTRSKKQLEERGERQERSNGAVVESFKKYNREVQDKNQEEEYKTPVWELERKAGDTDVCAECKKLSQAIHNAEESLSSLHGILYHQLNSYGSAYIETMKQFDAGVYSVNDIEDKIAALNSQTKYLVELLEKDLEPNDLVSEIEVEQMPTR
tara:strand:- start:683 stop:1633 length:951 start_codon:yes stop_codon:yes gene_type:complete